jgi:hypothetical protein
MNSLGIRSLLVLTPALLGLVMLPGCGEGPGTEITGTVRFDGEPLTGGKVTFYHPSKPGRNVTATIQPDGTYKIMAVPAGKVKVTVVALPPLRKHRDARRPHTDLNLPNIPLKYSDPETTDLVCPVRGGSQTFDIELKS